MKPVHAALAGLGRAVPFIAAPLATPEEDRRQRFRRSTSPIRPRSSATISRRWAISSLTTSSWSLGNGTVIPRAELLADAASGRLVYAQQDEVPGSQTVRVWGDTAVVTAQLWIQGTNDGVYPSTAIVVQRHLCPHAGAAGATPSARPRFPCRRACRLTRLPAAMAGPRPAPGNRSIPAPLRAPMTCGPLSRIPKLAATALDGGDGPVHNVCGVTRSILGQPWRWRGTAADDSDPGFQPDDLVDQLLLARGVAREELDAHRAPTLRDFMPDPSVFRDMDGRPTRLADAVEAGEKVTIFGDYDVDGATSAALLIRLLRELGLDARGLYPRPADGGLRPVRRGAGPDRRERRRR